MILEGVVTTRNGDRSINVVPMGPRIELPIKRLLLRPFQTSTTYRNLKRDRCGVFHVTDDVLLIARAALGRLDSMPPTFPAETIAGYVLSDCCRWYEFRVEQLDDSNERTEIEVTVVHEGQRRDFLGFNRAKHAVLEAAIVATRLHLVDPEVVRVEMKRLGVIVDKTAGPQERLAFDFVAAFVAEKLGSAPSAT